MNKLVCGVGFNDKTRPCWVDGKNVKEYSLWKHMLERGHNDTDKKSDALGMRSDTIKT